MNRVIAVAQLAEQLRESWSPRVIARVDDYLVKLARLQGALAWHSHEQQDELFYVVKGRLRLELESGAVELAEGELYVVSKGTPHNPVALPECWVLLWEHRSTSHTGTVQLAQTRTLAEQERPLLPGTTEE